MAVLSIAVGYRWLSASAAGLGPDHLTVFEAQPYGYDLPDWYGDHPVLLPWTIGDGQAFVVLAADPLARGPLGELGIPGYRYGRVLPSLIGRLLVGGNPSLVPLALLVVNSACVVTIGYLAWRLTALWGVRSLLLAANPAIFIGYWGDTAEPLGILLVIGSLGLVGRFGSTASSVLLGITRPSYATALVRRDSWWLALAAVGTALAFRILVVEALLNLETGDLSTNFTLPGLGYIDGWSRADQLSQFVMVAVASAAVLTILRGLPLGMNRRFSWAFISTGLLVLLLDGGVVAGYENLLRAAGVLPLVWVTWERAADPDGRPTTGS